MAYGLVGEAGQRADISLSQALRPEVLGRLQRGLGPQLFRLGLGEIRLYTTEAMTENLAYYARHGGM